jgi:hypothetical protein
MFSQAGMHTTPRAFPCSLRAAVSGYLCLWFGGDRELMVNWLEELSLIHQGKANRSQDRGLLRSRWIVSRSLSTP